MGAKSVCGFFLLISEEIDLAHPHPGTRERSGHGSVEVTILRTPCHTDLSRQRTVTPSHEKERCPLMIFTFNLEVEVGSRSLTRQKWWGLDLQSFVPIEGAGFLGFVLPSVKKGKRDGDERKGKARRASSGPPFVR